MVVLELLDVLVVDVVVEVDVELLVLTVEAVDAVLAVEVVVGGKG